MAEPLVVARAALRPVLDFALPPRCAGCGAITQDPHRFCLGCWSQLVFLGEPCCARCAMPFEFEQGADAVCGACLAHPPAFDRVRAAVAYGDIPRKVALRLKYGGRPGIAETIGRFMERHLDAPPDAILAPVPLHRWRIWKRGYNQAALIASSLSRRSGLEARLDLLIRIKATPPLKGMGPKERRDTVRGAFRVSPKHKAAVRGRTVILIDDVFTSGATTNVCAAVLKRAGAAEVGVLTWARVVKGDQS
ncbi:MAG TPA: ComF family protein [Allosphingosinicella sp.]|nr:ComF family protein [Allosphingosinicella sp.]